MRTTLLPSQRKSMLRRAAVRATYAPSVHNTQPWSLRIGAEDLKIVADRERQLHVLDPSGRLLMISCGCALMNARVSLAASGLGVRIEPLPDRAAPDLVARIHADPSRPPGGADLAALDHVIQLRQTNRRQFADDAVPDELLQTLVNAAASEHSVLHVVRDEDDRLAVATLSRHADAIQNVSPGYRAELRAWTTENPGRRDEVPNWAVPHADSLPVRPRSSRDQTLVLVCTAGDSPLDWVRAGEALQRVLLEVTRHGYAANPLTQVTEVPSARAQLFVELALDVYPHVLLRIGHAEATPAAGRRRLVDVMVDES